MIYSITNINSLSHLIHYNSILPVATVKKKKGQKLNIHHRRISITLGSVVVGCNCTVLNTSVKVSIEEMVQEMKKMFPLIAHP